MATMATVEQARAAASGSVYRDPRDGEVVQVLRASAWDPERWGPLTDGLAVVEVLKPGRGDHYTRPGEVAQRDLAGWEALEAADATVGEGP